MHVARFVRNMYIRPDLEAIIATDNPPPMQSLPGFSYLGILFCWHGRENSDVVVIVLLNTIATTIHSYTCFIWKYNPKITYIAIYAQL